MSEYPTFGIAPCFPFTHALSPSQPFSTFHSSLSPTRTLAVHPVPLRPSILPSPLPFPLSHPTPSCVILRFSLLPPKRSLVRDRETLPSTHSLSLPGPSPFPTTVPSSFVWVVLGPPLLRCDPPTHTHLPKTARMQAQQRGWVSVDTSRSPSLASMCTRMLRVAPFHVLGRVGGWNSRGQSPVSSPVQTLNAEEYRQETTTTRETRTIASMNRRDESKEEEGPRSR